MWMLVWRPIIVALGVAGGLMGAVTTAASVDKIASDTLAGFVVAMMVFQAIVSIALIVLGAWGSMRQWLKDRSTTAAEGFGASATPAGR